jgi:hypothetical protein
VSTTKPLNVHHKRYRRGAKPWEYEANELIVLCEDCHEEWHQIKDLLTSAIGELDVDTLRILLGLAEAYLLSDEKIGPLKIRDYSHLHGIAAWAADRQIPWSAMYDKFKSGEPITADFLTELSEEMEKIRFGEN